MISFPAWTRLLTLWLLLACSGSAWAALTSEEATRVGGDLSKVGGGISQLNDQLAEVKAAANKIALALPELSSDLRKVQQTIKAGRGEGEMAANALGSVGTNCPLGTGSGIQAANPQLASKTCRRRKPFAWCRRPGAA